MCTIVHVLSAYLLMLIIVVYFQWLNTGHNYFFVFKILPSFASNFHRMLSRTLDLSKNCSDIVHRKGFLKPAFVCIVCIVVTWLIGGRYYTVSAAVSRFTIIAGADELCHSGHTLLSAVTGGLVPASQHRQLGPQTVSQQLVAFFCSRCSFAVHLRM